MADQPLRRKLSNEYRDIFDPHPTICMLYLTEDGNDARRAVSEVGLLHLFGQFGTLFVFAMRFWPELSSQKPRKDNPDAHDDAAYNPDYFLWAPLAIAVIEVDKLLTLVKLQFLDLTMLTRQASISFWHL